jgi:uncharacterized damage-inducible protein DinB
MFRYEAWANERMQDFLSANSPPHEALTIWSHLIVTKQMWLARAVGEEYNRLELWSVHPIAEAGSLLGEVERRWIGFLADLDENELARVVTFHNTKGQPQADSLGDILRHLLMHGAYHRGQIATLVQAAGREVPVTDFILFSREEQPAPPPGESKKMATRVSGRKKSV